MVLHLVDDKPLWHKIGLRLFFFKNSEIEGTYISLHVRVYAEPYAMHSKRAMAE